jgi:hypothetical protein
MVVAAPGHVLVEADSSAIEAVLVGYFARSERYIRLAKAGVHDWLNAALHGQLVPLDLTDIGLRAACQEVKRSLPKEDRERCKRVVHLTNYRGTPERMHEEYPEDFPTVAAARKLQQFYLDTEPGQDLQAWWRETLDRAGHEKALTNPFGLRHRFYHIFTWNSRRACYEPHGDDAKRAIAFLPQSTASFIQDEYVLTLWERVPMFREWLCLPVHDSLLCEVPEERAEIAAECLHEVFTQPIAELGGLSIGAEVSVGRNWAEMTPWTPKEVPV